MVERSKAAGERMPTMFLSHGAPPLADDPVWSQELAERAAAIPRPSAILVVSAHWEAAPLTIGATRTVPLVYDFYGFEERYYQVTYPAPGAPELADAVASLASIPVRHDEERGLDHGAYVPLVEMYPAADIPVLQVSMPTLHPGALFGLGVALAPLRDEGVLVIGSGFTTHNLHAARFAGGPYGDPPAWSSEFDEWLDETLRSGDVDAILDFERKAPAAATAHPRTEHFAPLFVALGAASPFGEARTAIDGFYYGLSKRSVELN